MRNIGPKNCIVIHKQLNFLLHFMLLEQLELIDEEDGNNTVFGRVLTFINCALLILQGSGDGPLKTRGGTPGCPGALQGSPGQSLVGKITSN